jgi:hypothetical protein
MVGLVKLSEVVASAAPAAAYVAAEVSLDIVACNTSAEPIPESGGCLDLFRRRLGDGP